MYCRLNKQKWQPLKSYLGQNIRENQSKPNQTLEFFSIWPISQPAHNVVFSIHLNKFCSVRNTRNVFLLCCGCSNKKLTTYKEGETISIAADGIWADLLMNCFRLKSVNSNYFDILCDLMLSQVHRNNIPRLHRAPFPPSKLVVC